MSAANFIHYFGKTLNMTAFLIIIATVLIVFCLLCIYFFNFTCRAKKHRTTNEEMLASRKKHMHEHADVFEKGFKWTAKQKSERLEIISADGLKLRADFIDCPNRKGIIAMFHGYRSIPLGDFSVVNEYYYNLGYALLLVHQRAHGESEGRYITFGAKERYDCRNWCNKLQELFPGVQVFLDGVSMGCSTVLAASELDLPENVRGIIADCGFTSPGEIIANVMKLWIKLPKFPLYYIVGWMCRVFAGFSFDEFSTVDAMKKNKLPIIFIHGTGDNFVPHDMTLRAHEACIAEKEIYLVEKAGHGLSYLVETENCQRAISAFLERNTK